MGQLCLLGLCRMSDKRRQSRAYSFTKYIRAFQSHRDRPGCLIQGEGASRRSDGQTVLRRLMVDLGGTNDGECPKVADSVDKVGERHFLPA